MTIPWSVLDKIRSATEQSPPVWPGWDHSHTPLCIYQRSMWAVLINHPDPPAPFNRIDGHGSSIYVAESTPSYLIANTALPIAGVQTATMILDGDAPVETLAALALHEAFHAYQANIGFPMANIMHMAEYPQHDPQVNTLARIEALCLHHALTDGADRRVWLTRAIDLRHERQSLLSDELRCYEDQNEIQEGLATYVEMKILPPTAPRFERNLAELLRVNVAGRWANRQRFYYSGMAYGMALDHVCPEWQTKLMKTGYPALALLLADTIGHRPSKPSVDLLSSLDYESLLAEEVTAAMEAEEKKLKAVESLFPGTGDTVEFTLDYHDERDIIGAGFNPFDMVFLKDGSRLHPSIFRLKLANGEELELLGPCLEMQPFTRFRIERPHLEISIAPEQGYIITAPDLRIVTRTPPVLTAGCSK